MKPAEIAKLTNVSEMTVSNVRNKSCKTRNIQLAIEIARATGQKPIDLISEDVKALALASHPWLSKKFDKPKVHTKRVSVQS